MDSRLTTVALVLGFVAFAAGSASVVVRFIHIAKFGEDLDSAAASTSIAKASEEQKASGKRANPLDKPSVQV